MTIVTKSGSNTLHGSASLFVIPQAFNSSNVKGMPANQRKDIQPAFTLGGPIVRDRIWLFGSYRRTQQDQTLNNAVVPQELRGDQIYLKGSTQISKNHNLTTSFQWDRTTANNSVIRSSVAGSTSSSGGISSATMSMANPAAFGKLVTGGPLVGMNYTWVMRPKVLFQFITNWMIDKPQNVEPTGDLGVTRVIQSNPAGNIGASLTTIAQEGSLGVINTDKRSMLYIYPSLSFMLNKWGTHDFKAGSELYPFLRRTVDNDIRPVEYYFRPPGTSGSADILFERDTFRALGGTGTATHNEAWENVYSFYFQDRWKPVRRVAVKAGL